MTAIQTEFVIHDGLPWVRFSAVTDAVATAVYQRDTFWRDTIDQQRIKFEKRIDELHIESNAFNKKWCDAEQRCAKFDRAEEAMREYEQTIGDQAKEIGRLKQELAAATLPKRKPANQDKVLRK